MLSRLVLYHLRAGQLVNRIPSRKAKFRFFRDTQDEAAAIILLTLADRRAMRGVLSKKKQFVFHEDELFKMLKDFFKEHKTEKKPERLLDGNAIMDFLGVTSGPIVGDLLKSLGEAQAIGTVNTYEQACDFLKKLYKKNNNKVIEFDACRMN